RDRGDERVLDEVHQADGDGPASADRLLNRLLEASVVGAARHLGADPGGSGSLPFPSVCSCSPLGFHPITSCARSFPIDLASDASTRLSPRTASGTATPPATSSQSDPESSVVPRSRRSGDAAILSAATLGVHGLAVARYGAGAHATTIAFCTLTAAQLVHALNYRSGFSRDQGLPALLMAVGATLAVQLAALPASPLLRLLRPPLIS